MHFQRRMQHSFPTFPPPPRHQQIINIPDCGVDLPCCCCDRSRWSRPASRCRVACSVDHRQRWPHFRWTPLYDDGPSCGECRRLAGVVWNRCVCLRVVSVCFGRLCSGDACWMMIKEATNIRCVAVRMRRRRARDSRGGVPQRRQKTATFAVSLMKRCCERGERTRNVVHCARDRERRLLTLGGGGSRWRLWWWWCRDDDDGHKGVVWWCACCALYVLMLLLELCGGGSVERVCDFWLERMMII